MKYQVQIKIRNMRRSLLGDTSEALCELWRQTYVIFHSMLNNYRTKDSLVEETRNVRMSIIPKFCWRGRRFHVLAGAISAPRTAQTAEWRTVNETIRRAFVVKAQLLDALCLHTEPQILWVPSKPNATIYKIGYTCFQTQINCANLTKILI